MRDASDALVLDLVEWIAREPRPYAEVIETWRTSCPRLTPKNLKPNPDSIAQGSFYGFICMGLMLMTGVSGPLMDTFFLGGNFGRREVVATKATCQVASHFIKLVYFGGIIDQAASLDPVLAVVAVAASMLGTTLARRLLEAMSDAQFRTWANRLITAITSPTPATVSRAT